MQQNVPASGNGIVRSFDDVVSNPSSSTQSHFSSLNVNNANDRSHENMMKIMCGL